MNVRFLYRRASKSAGQLMLSSNGVQAFAKLRSRPSRQPLTAPHFLMLSDLGIDSATPSGKLVIGIFAALAEYDREMILEKTRAGQLLAKAQGKHIGRRVGVNQENFQKVKSATQKGLSVLEIVNLTGISLTSVKRYRKTMVIN